MLTSIAAGSWWVFSLTFITAHSSEYVKLNSSSSDAYAYFLFLDPKRDCRWNHAGCSHFLDPAWANWAFVWFEEVLGWARSQGLNTFFVERWWKSWLKRNNCEDEGIIVNTSASRHHFVFIPNALTDVVAISDSCNGPYHSNYVKCTTCAYIVGE